MKFEKLENIASIHKGKKHELIKEPISSSVRFLQIDDLRNDNLIKYTNDTNGALAQEDDLMIVWDGANAGTIGFGKKGLVGSTIAVLRKRESEKYSTEFLGKFLQSQFYYLRKNTTGATIPHIDRKLLETLKIPVIKIEDQIQIANLLYQAEDLIKQRKESIRLLDELLKSTFLEMFGQMNDKNFTLESLDDVSTKINDGEHGTVLRTETGVRYLMARNINRFNEIDLSEVSFVSKETHDKMYKRCNPKKDDILIVCVGATIGKVVIVPEMDEFSIARSVALVKPDFRKVNSRYLLWFFNSEFAKRQIKNSSQAAAQAGLYIGNIKKIIIPVPTLELQNKFAQIVEKTEAIKIQYQSSLHVLKNLYASLSQRAFKGELEFSKKEGLLMAAEPTGIYQKG